jgi:hypothetical protein
LSRAIGQLPVVISRPSCRSSFRARARVCGPIDPF